MMRYLLCRRYVGGVGSGNETVRKNGSDGIGGK